MTIYRGVGTPAVTRMRGALLLALGHRALPVTALPFVLEELESAHDAWLTAVAAHVLRKYPEPSASFAEPLLSAVIYIQHRDEIVRLANYGGLAPGGETTTAMSEIMQTIGWLGRAGAACVARLEDLLAQNPGPATSAMVGKALEALRADGSGAVTSHSCCCGEKAAAAAPSAPVRDISGLRFQDHAGTELTFARSVPWPAVHRGVFLHALRQPDEVSAHDVQVRQPAADVAANPDTASRSGSRPSRTIRSTTARNACCSTRKAGVRRPRPAIGSFEPSVTSSP